MRRMHAPIPLEQARQARQAALHEVAAVAARYQAMFEGVADAILVEDEARRYVDANTAATALLGSTHEERCALHVEDIVTAPPMGTAAEYDQVSDRAHWRGESAVRRKDGHMVPVEAMATMVRLPTTTLSLSVVRDVTPRRAREQQQQAFLGMITHELRTPLTGLRGYADLMRRRGEYDAQAVSVIVAQAAQLDRLIDDLRDTSRIDADRLRLERTSVDMGGLVQSVAEQAQTRTAHHTIRVAAGADPLLGW